MAEAESLEKHLPSNSSGSMHHLQEELRARIRNQSARGLELISRSGVTGFLPKGDEGTPAESLSLLELGALSTLVKEGWLLQHRDEGFARMRYELLA